MARANTKPKPLGDDRLIKIVEAREEKRYRVREGMHVEERIAPGHYVATVDLSGGRTRQFVSEVSEQDAIEKARGYIAEQRKRKDGGSLAGAGQKVKVRGGVT